MSIAQGLLSAIIENPADDVPRLVYADWLEDNGQPERAQFIRTQIERAKLPPGDVRHDELEAREWELSRGRVDGWREGLPEIKGIGWGGWKTGFSRGFIETVHARLLTNYEQAHRRIRKLIPLRGLHIARLNRGFHALSRPSFANLARLTLIGGPIFDAGLESLASCPYLENLESLTLFNHSYTALGFSALTASTYLPALRELNLTSHCGPDELRSLGASALFSRLTHLELSSCILTDARLMDVLRLPGPERLQWFNLTSNHIDDAGATALAESPALGKLRVLYLASNGIGPAGAEALASSASLAGLQVFSLTRNQRLGDDGLFRLTRYARFRPHELHLGVTAMRETGLRALLWSPLMPSLRTLIINDNPFGDAGAEAVASAPAAVGLTVLDLSSTGMTDAGAVAMIRSPYLGRLRYLKMTNNNRITPDIWLELRERFGSALQ